MTLILSFDVIFSPFKEELIIIEKKQNEKTKQKTKNKKKKQKKKKQKDKT